MIGIAIVALGVVALSAGIILLRRGGSAWRVGRLLAVAPELTLDEVAAAARAGEQRYVRSSGRVSSDEEFPDEHDRPLVFRRQRIQRLDGTRWTDLEDVRVAVPFGIEERGAFLAVDADALGEGLVVVPRVAEGPASELPEEFAARLPALDPMARVRVRIDQLSAVERSIAAGVPVLGRDGAPLLTAGLGRPLIVTPLEPAAAMRVLGAERRGAVKLAAGLLVGGLALIAAGLVALLLGVP